MSTDIRRFTTAEQSSEGPGVKPGGITGSATEDKKRGVKRTLDVKTIETKYEAIMEVEKGIKSKKQIAADLKIPPSTLSSWLRKSDEIKKSVFSGEIGPQRKKARGGKFPEIEEALLSWFKFARSQNVALSGEILREKARHFAKELGVSESDFDCSSGWLERFKTRHGITFKKICGESKSVETASNEMDEWRKRLDTILADYNADDVFNADETGIFYKLMPDKTLEFKSVQCHGGKMSKERLTALVCSNMSGTEKLPLLVIGKSLKPRCFKNVSSFPTEYTANRKAWMTSEIFTDWLRKLDRKMEKKKRRIVLLIDNCPAHPVVNGLKAVNVVFLPPNTTSVTQPMDQGIIKNLKVHYRKLLVQRRIRAIDMKKEVTVSVLDAMRMLRQAWDCVSQQTLTNCYRHAGFVSEAATDISDDPEDDIPLAQLTNLAPGVTMTDYATVDDALQTCETVTEDTIVQNIISARSIDDNDDEDTEDTENDLPPPPKPTIEDALAACDLLSTFVECYGDSDSTVFKDLSRVGRFVNKVHFTKVYCRESKISNFFTASADRS